MTIGATPPSHNQSKKICNSVSQKHQILDPEKIVRLCQPIQKVLSVSGNPVQTLAESGLYLDGVAETFGEGAIGGIEEGEVDVQAEWAGLFVYRDGSSF